MNKKYILLFVLILIIGIAVYLLIFKNKSSVTKSIENLNQKVSEKIVPSKPQYENPLTGEIIYSDFKPEFLYNSPLGVMINNATPARPQAGLAKADVVYEIVAEGGITRFLAFFLSDIPEKVGPIRSVREYYVVIIKELGDAMLMHIGYSPQALDKIKEWNVNSLGLAGADFYRDNRGNPEVATEHTAFANAKDLITFGKAINYNNKKDFVPWKFNEKIDLDNFSKANNILINFWTEGDYSAYFKYDLEKNEYVRYSGVIDGKPQALIDDLTKSEIRVKNVIVQFANEVPIPGDEKNRLSYEMIGNGNALILRNGVVINAKWVKKSLLDRTIFYDLKGQEIEFNRGKIWISVVPSRNENQVKVNK